MNPEERLRQLRDSDRWRSVRVPRPAARAGDRRGAAPARTGQLVAAFVIVIAVIGGLVVGLTALHRSVPPASTRAPTASVPSPSTSTAAPATFSVVPGPTHTWSATTVPSACTSAQLTTESKQDGGGAAGSYIQGIAVLNTGSDCLLPADALRVGGAVTRLASENAPHGVVLPALAVARLTVATEEACQPGGTKANIDPSKPILPIVLVIGGRSRTLTARFPQGTCATPYAEGYIDDPGSSVLGHGPFAATVTAPSKTPRGTLRYEVALRSTGSDARVVTACPSATEVLTDELGTVVTRAITLRCTIGATLEPDVPVTVPVTTTIPTAGDWSIAWYLGGGAGTTAASTTCTLAQLAVSEPGPPGAAAGSWVQLVSVRNRGDACVLPVSAFGLSGTAARAARPEDAAGFALAARSTTRIAFSAPTTCVDGSPNIRSTSPLATDAKPLTLTLGGHDAAGLDQRFPYLACAGPTVDRAG